MKHQSLIREATTRLEVAEDTSAGVASITATLARGDIINRNWRYYSSTTLERAAVAARDRVANGEVIGLLDHPDFWDGAKGRTENAVIVWTDLYMDGADLKGKGHILDTSKGRDLLGQKKGGMHLALSTNGYALEQRFVPAKDVPAAWDGDADELIQVIDDFELLTIDVVNDPSNVFARIEREAASVREAYRQEKELHEKEGDPVTEEMRKLKDELAAAEALLAEQEETHVRAIELAERVAVARVRLAEAGKVPEAIRKAAMTAAEAAESVEAAEAAVTELLDSIKTGHGNNGVPATESKKAAGFDPIAEFKKGNY